LLNKAKKECRLRDDFCKVTHSDYIGCISAIHHKRDAV